MKKYIILLGFGLCMLTLTSCLKEYLDRAPDAGLTEKDVFTKYENFKKYFDAVYGQGPSNLKGVYGKGAYNIKNAFPLFFSLWGYQHTWEAMTDMSDLGRLSSAHTIKAGMMGNPSSFTYNEGARPIMGSMFRIIRISNLTIQNLGMLTDATQQEKDDLKAQAHFVRAFAHFTLFRIWGGMPYITKALDADDQWDIPRLPKHETLMRIAADMDTAVVLFEKAGLMRRDAGPGQAGNLNSPDQFRPNGTAAKGLRARALLYAASPLNNKNGVKDWEDAAKANWDAIKVAEQFGFTLLSAADYKTNFVGAPYTNEQLWGWYAGTRSYNEGSMFSLIPGVFANKPLTWTESPTQNTVDKFETRFGEPLNTAADRDAAIAAGHYKEQDPYANRDPRFYIDIIHNQSPAIGWQNGKAQIWYQTVNGKTQYSELLNQSYAGITHTGYYNRKYWGNQSVKNQIKPDYTDPIIRLAELYLNYAEAANEAYGPNTPAPGATMTAVQAINVIRARVNMPDVLAAFTTDKNKFRERIKNERNVELCFEGHYFHDIRRWKDAPVTMAGPLYGMDIEKVPVSATYPTGFKYTRIKLPAERQSTWKDAMYYFPFEQEDMFKMKNFTFNEVW